MAPQDPAVQEYLATVTHPTRRRDAETMLELMARVTGHPARMWGATIVGFGEYHYKYASGREGDGPATAFAARKEALVIYLPDGIGNHTDLLADLGPHKTGVGCLYIKDLSQVDGGVLEKIVTRLYKTLTADTYTLRARESSE